MLEFITTQIVPYLLPIGIGVVIIGIIISLVFKHINGSLKNSNKKTKKYKTGTHWINNEGKDY